MTHPAKRAGAKESRSASVNPAEVVEAFLASGRTVAEVAGRYGLDEQTVRDWIRQASDEAVQASPMKPGESRSRRQAAPDPAVVADIRGPDTESALFEALEAVARADASEGEARVQASAAEAKAAKAARALAREKKKAADALARAEVAGEAEAAVRAEITAVYAAAVEAMVRAEVAAEEAVVEAERAAMTKVAQAEAAAAEAVARAERSAAEARERAEAAVAARLEAEAGARMQIAAVYAEAVEAVVRAEVSAAERKAKAEAATREETAAAYAAAVEAIIRAEVLAVERVDEAEAVAVGAVALAETASARLDSVRALGPTATGDEAAARAEIAALVSRLQPVEVWVQMVGRTVAEARRGALEQLGVDESEAEFEVLDHGSRWLPGRVRVRARIRVPQSAPNASVRPVRAV